MATVKLDIVTAEKLIYSGDVDIVIAPGSEGQLGILPHHAPLMTALDAGELIARKGTEEYTLAISGGFLEVLPDRIIVLADSAERAEEIDISRAEEAKKRAQDSLAHSASQVEVAAAEAALHRAIARIEVAERIKRRKKI